MVEVQKHGVWFLANNVMRYLELGFIFCFSMAVCSFSCQLHCPTFQVDQFIHRILVEEDISKPEESSQEIFDAAGEAGKKLYSKGDFARSELMDLDLYLLRKVHMLNVLISVSFSARGCCWDDY